MDKTKQSTEEKVKVVSEIKTTEGQRIITLEKGTKRMTHKEHNAPSFMCSEE